MKKFRANYYGVITVHEVVKETEKQIVFINKYANWIGNEITKEVRENKVSKHYRWHDSFEEAKNDLIEYRDFRLKSLKSQLLKAMDVFAKVKNLTPE